LLTKERFKCNIQSLAGKIAKRPGSFFILGACTEPILPAKPALNRFQHQQVKKLLAGQSG
jgi:hypothetical protein